MLTKSKKQIIKKQVLGNSVDEGEPEFISQIKLNTLMAERTKPFAKYFSNSQLGIYINPEKNEDVSNFVFRTLNIDLTKTIKEGDILVFNKMEKIKTNDVILVKLWDRQGTLPGELYHGV